MPLYVTRLGDNDQQCDQVLGIQHEVFFAHNVAQGPSEEVSPGFTGDKEVGSAERHMEASVWSGGWGGAGSPEKLEASQVGLSETSQKLGLMLSSRQSLLGFCSCFKTSGAGAEAQNVYDSSVGPANKSHAHRGKFSVRVSWMVVVGWGWVSGRR